MCREAARWNGLVQSVGLGVASTTNCINIHSPTLVKVRVPGGTAHMYEQQVSIIESFTQPNHDGLAYIEMASSFETVATSQTKLIASIF